MLSPAHRFARHRHTVALALCVFFLASCGTFTSILKLNHVQELREVQADFNQATSLENQLALNSDPMAQVSSRSQVQSTYRTVLARVSALIQSKGKELGSDKLLGTAYTIKWLSEWRLGDYDAALATLDGMQGDSMTLLPRDKLLAQASRGLIKNDQAFAKGDARGDEYKAAKTLLQQAINDVQGALDAAPADHDLRRYLTMAQMISLRNWYALVANQDTSTTPGFDPQAEENAFCAAAKPVLASYDKAFGKDANADKMWKERAKNWGAMCAIPAAQPANQ